MRTVNQLCLPEARSTSEKQLIVYHSSNSDKHVYGHRMHNVFYSALPSALVQSTSQSNTELTSRLECKKTMRSCLQKTNSVKTIKIGRTLWSSWSVADIIQDTVGHQSTAKPPFLKPNPGPAFVKLVAKAEQLTVLFFQCHWRERKKTQLL